MTETKKKKKESFKKTPPSDEFLNAISTHTSSITGECDFCGRFYYSFNDGSYDYEYGEFEKYAQLAKENPDKYIMVDGSVCDTFIDGRTYIWGCECNEVRRYEEWVWSHREILMDYLRRRTEKELKEAKAEFIAVHEVHVLGRNILLSAPALKIKNVKEKKRDE